jgi:hypothetical protein
MLEMRPFANTLIWYLHPLGRVVIIISIMLDTCESIVTTLNIGG